MHSPLAHLRASPHVRLPPVPRLRAAAGPPERRRAAPVCCRGRPRAAHARRCGDHLGHTPRPNRAPPTPERSLSDSSRPCLDIAGREPRLRRSASPIARPRHARPPPGHRLHAAADLRAAPAPAPLAARHRRSPRCAPRARQGILVPAHAWTSKFSDVLRIGASYVFESLDLDGSGDGGCVMCRSRVATAYVLSVDFFFLARVQRRLFFPHGLRY